MFAIVPLTMHIVTLSPSDNSKGMIVTKRNIMIKKNEELENLLLSKSSMNVSVHI
jgi:hypothetical protein